eukprot:13629-Heterococcus_DN1.PRE.2
MTHTMHSTGALVYEMITGKTLFMYACPEAMMVHKWAVGNGQLDEHPAFYKDEDIMPGIGQHARDLVLKLLHCNPLDRLGNVTDGAAAVMKHPFFGVLSSGTASRC